MKSASQKAKEKAYRERPEVKARRRASQKAWMQATASDPAYKAKRKAYRDRYRSKRSGYAKERRRRPEVKAALRDRHLQKRYGLTLAAYNQMLEAQGGVCAICGCEPTVQKNKFVVDHDHATGQVRAILCHRCNVGVSYQEHALTGKWREYVWRHGK